jgi:hypothetical protein
MDMLTPAQVGKRLGVGMRRARELMSVGVVPATWLGGRVYSPRAAFEAWVTEVAERSLQAARGHAASAKPGEGVRRAS